MKDFWETRYKVDEFVYGKLPNKFFKEIIDPLKFGRLFLPGEGEGRNAVYAAALGWSVEAVDFAEKGRKKAIQLASEKGTYIDYNIGDLLTYSLKPRSFDLIALIYLHLAPDIRTSIHTKLQKALKKNGILILEAFSKKQLGESTGGPQDPDLLYDISMLQNDFSDLSIDGLYETNQKLDEGQFHQGESHQIRMIARRL